MQKTLLTLGDSWTDENYRNGLKPHLGYKQLGIRPWGGVLAEQIGYKHVNKGIAGASNERIVKVGIDYLKDNPVDMICVLWSCAHRIDFFGYLQLNPVNAFFGHECNEFSRSVFNPEVYVDLMFKRKQGADLHIPTEFFRSMWILKQFADSKNIPIYFACGVDVWPTWQYSVIEEKEYRSFMWKRFLKTWVDSTYFKEFDKDQKNIIGWPFLPAIGGFSLSHKLGNGKDQDNTVRIGDGDEHPNQEGHNQIADWFFKKIKI